VSAAEFEPAEVPAWRWIATPSGNLRWSEWEGDCAVYHRPSGKTHFVNAATRILIGRILSAPCDAAAAADALAHIQGVEPDDAFRTHVWGLLVRLEELGLVERT